MYFIYYKYEIHTVNFVFLPKELYHLSTSFNISQLKTAYSNFLL
jgi:hypothetical protein